MTCWSSVYRKDSGPRGQADKDCHIPPARDQPGDEFVLSFGVERPEAKQPADATVWFGVYTTAPSDEGPLVGGRAGHSGLRLASLMQLLENKESVRTNLRMNQMGVPGDGDFSKFTLEVLGFAGEPPKTQFRFAKIKKNDMVETQMYLHNKILGEYVDLSLSPFGESAIRNNWYIGPSYDGIDAVHAPFWNDNIELPCFAFFTMNAVVDFNDDMVLFFERASKSILRRHAWPLIGNDSFETTCRAQFESTEPTCSANFKLACATVVSMCCLLSTSSFYRFDNAYVGRGCEEAVGIESFQDPMRCGGGDCEDLAGLNHRVFRWLNLGNPRYKDATKYWRKHGGWPTGSVLDWMQRISYWYVSYGTLGSVTSAHVEKDGAKRTVTDQVIGSAADRSCAFGGHMWMEAANVVEFEELVRRANGSPVNVRPDYDDERPAWVRDMPHLLGEGTGALYPLPLPLGCYAKELRPLHEKHNKALRLLHANTQIIARMQVERWCNHEEERPDTRLSTFYRQNTEVFTDDLLMRGIPFHSFASVLTDGVRHKDRPVQQLGIAGIPGEAMYDENKLHGTFGVDARDRFEAMSEQHSNVALMPYPPLTPEAAQSFKRRIEHTLPFRQPWISVSNTANIERKLNRAVASFLAEAKKHVSRNDHATTRQDFFTIVDVMVRDNILSQKIRTLYLRDVIQCAQNKILVGVHAELDFFDHWHYGVRIELTVALRS